MNTAWVHVQDVEEPSWIDRLSSFAVTVMDAVGCIDWDLSLVLCSAGYMTTLNHDYRNKEGPTDVLSFGLGEYVEEGKERRFLPGDIVICPTVMEDNAREFGVSSDEELRRLVIHGILHLSGMDHDTDDASEPMLVRQEEILQALAKETVR